MKSATIFIFLCLSFYANSQKSKYVLQSEVDINGFKYQTVINDPLNTRIYKLSNGLTVYLSSNKIEPRIQTRIIVGVGSLNDPPGLTGLAHYFEHLMFNGSNKIGSLNWEKEEPLINEMSQLYELYRSTNDSIKSARIYYKIDSVSQEIAKYSNPMELPEIYVSMGAKFSAYTYYHMTSFDNLFPSNELEKWLILEKERFSNIVPRAFCSELERVYEEYNGNQSRDFGKAIYALSEELYRENFHITPIVGYQNHIKRPSVKALLKFFDSYYVPNNMTLCLSGDFDYARAILLIDNSFGKLPRKKYPDFQINQNIKPKDLKERVVYGKGSEYLLLGYLINNFDEEDRKSAVLLNNILDNKIAGLLKNNLIKSKKEKGQRKKCGRKNTKHI